MHKWWILIQIFWIWEWLQKSPKFLSEIYQIDIAADDFGLPIHFQKFHGINVTWLPVSQLIIDFNFYWIIFLCLSKKKNSIVVLYSCCFCSILLTLLFNLTLKWFIFFIQFLQIFPNDGHFSRFHIHRNSISIIFFMTWISDLLKFKINFQIVYSLHNNV